MISLQDKVTLITGGSRGIGRACALMFAQAGSDIIINYRSDDSAANSLAKEIKSLGRKALLQKADVANLSQVKQMVADSVKEFGHIDILVNNAGIWEENKIDEMSDDDLRRTIDVNLYGTFYPLMAVVPHMKERKSGVIVNISSTAGQRGEADHSPYAATKSAVIGITKSLGPELIEHGIRVNCVAPGWVETDMSRASLESDDAAGIVGKIPIGRVGTPEELAGAVLYMASDLSTFVIGEVLNVNGGAVLCG